MTTFLDDLRAMRDDKVVARNKLTRALHDAMDLQKSLTVKLDFADLEIKRLDFAIDPESADMDAYKRGYQAAEQMAREALQNQYAARRDELNKAAQSEDHIKYDPVSYGADLGSMVLQKAAAVGNGELNRIKKSGE